jgi:hypothetical protein
METTVKSCTKVKEWNGKNIYSVEFSDGTKGNSFGSEIPVGTNKTELLITPKEGYPDDVKMKRANGFAGGGQGKPRAGNESFALAYAKDLVIAMIPKMEKQLTSGDLTKVITATAEVFYTWMEGKKK